MEKHPSLHLGAVAIEKGAFGSPSTKVANYYFYIYAVMHKYIYLSFHIQLNYNIY